MLIKDNQILFRAMENVPTFSRKATLLLQLLVVCVIGRNQTTFCLSKITHIRINSTAKKIKYQDILHLIFLSPISTLQSHTIKLKK